MTRRTLDENELDRLLQAQMPGAPQVPQALRQRVRERTVLAATAAARAHDIAVLKAHQQTRLLRARQQLVRDLLLCLLLGAVVLAILPAFAKALAPTFQNLHAGGIDGLSMTLALVAIVVGMATGFPRQARALFGI